MDQIPWWRPELGKDEQAHIAAVLASNYLNDGDVTEKFETEIAARVGASYAVAVTSGTSALTLALMAIGVGPGDEVIVPDVTFVATANAVLLAGAQPVLADVDSESLCLCPRAAAAAITGKTKAIIPVHVSGRAGTLLQIMDLAERHGIAVVEDAAEVLLSRHQGRHLGTFGKAGCLSFSPNKIITTGQGGMVLTSSPEIHRRLRELKDQGRAARGTGGDDDHPVVGYNFKLTNLQAAVGLGQLALLERRMERQRRTYMLYREGLAHCQGVRVFPVNTAGDETALWVDAIADNRDALCRHLEASGIGTRKLWRPLHTQKPYHRPDAEFPVSTRLAPQALWLPTAFQISDRQVVRVIDAILQFYAK